MNNDLIWFNQTLLTYSDNMYGSNSSLDISLVVSASPDYKYYSPPSLRFSIISKSDGARKICNLTYVDAIDLILRLKQSQKNPVLTFETGAELLCRYQKNRSLKFTFKVVESDKSKVVEIEILHNESDFGRIYIPFGSIFFAIIKKLEIYANECDSLAFSLTNRSIMTQLLDINIGLRNDVKCIPDQIISNVNIDKPFINNESELSDDINSDISESDNTQDNFSGFMNDKIDEIKVDEISKIESSNNKKTQLEINSPFIYKVLNGDIQTLENIILASIANNDTFNTIIKTIQDGYKDKSILPGITDESLLAYKYMSTLIFQTHFKNYAINNNPIPPSIEILKYDFNGEIETHNTELFYDVLLISSYIKVLRSRIEDKESNAMENKAIIHLAIRCFLDILIFSFYNKVNKSLIKSCIIERFKVYKESGFFNVYEELLASYNCNEINVMDIDSYLNQVLDLKEDLYKKDIIKLVDDQYKENKTILPSTHNFSSEQIDEIIVLEVNRKLKLSPNMKLSNYSKEVLDLFEGKPISSKTNKPKQKTEIVKEPNIYKVSYQYRNEIPESIRNDFLDYLKTIETSNVEWNFNCEIEELGDNILKAIYCWNDSNKNETYKNFIANKFESCALTKDLILVRLKTKNENNEENKDEESEWDF